MIDMIATRGHVANRGSRRELNHIVECASLRNLDLFRHLPPADLRGVAEAACFHRIPARKPIAPAGGDRNRLWFLTQGLVKVTRFEASGAETILYLVKAGELFGAEFEDPRSNTQIITLQPAVAASICASTLERVLGQPVLGAELDRVRALRLQQVEDRLTEVSTGRVPVRTARTVLRLAREFPARMACGTRVSVRFTQQDIASMIGASREVTSLTLNDFRRRGWLGMHDRHMCVHDADGLKELCL